MRTCLAVLLVSFAGCAIRPIEPVIPYAAWPLVAKIKSELDRPMPESARMCADRSATYSGASANADPIPGFYDEACQRALSAYEDRRRALQAEFAYYTGPDYRPPEAVALAR